MHSPLETEHSITTDGDPSPTISSASAPGLSTFAFPSDLHSKLSSASFLGRWVVMMVWNFSTIQS